MVAMKVDKCCVNAASESAAKQIMCENTFLENFAKSTQMYA